MRGGVEKMGRDEIRKYAARKITALGIRKYAAFSGKRKKGNKPFI
jgi:hypothetical protein